MTGGRRARPARQFGRYAVCGILAGIVDFGVFYAAAVLLLPALGQSDPLVRLLGLRPAPIAAGLRSAHYIWDKVIAFVFSNQTAYVLNVLWVFTPGRHGKAVEFLLFTGVSALSVGVGTAFAWLLIKVGGVHTTYAYAANVVASTAINYGLRKYLVFKG